MKTFIYTATNAKGETVKNQRMEAEDVNDFLDKIHEKGLFCSDYKEAKGNAARKIHKFSTTELSYDARQMSAMMTSGLTLVKTLDIMCKEQEKEANKAIYKDIYDSVQKGTSFSEALKAQDGAFPNYFISMIQAGESSGNMDVVMKKLEEYYDNEARTNRKIKSAMIYPIVLAVMCVVIVIGMFVFIMPTFRELLNEEDMTGVTKAVFGVADFMIAKWYVILIVIGVVIFGVYYALKFEAVHYAFDRFKLKMPKVGPLIVKIYTAKFGSTLASLYSSGIPMVECLEKSSNIIGNDYFSDCFVTVIDEVKQGEALSTSIQRTGIFESMFCSIIFVGEESGALDTILTKSAAFYQEEADEAISGLVGMIEPLMIIIMGCVIGFCLAGIYPAMYASFNSVT